MMVPLCARRDRHRASKYAAAAHTFSDNLQASLVNGVLTIQDFGLGHTLSMHVSLASIDIVPDGTWELFEPQHSPGSNFYGLTLAYVSGGIQLS